MKWHKVRMRSLILYFNIRIVGRLRSGKTSSLHMSVFRQSCWLVFPGTGFKSLFQVRLIISFCEELVHDRADSETPTQTES